MQVVSLPAAIFQFGSKPRWRCVAIERRHIPACFGPSHPEVYGRDLTERSPMLKIFELEALDATGRVIQSVVYRYGRPEPHLAPDIRRLLSRRDRESFTGMRARGLTIRASREAI